VPVRILIVDDQEIVRNSLSLLFETDDKIEVVGLAETGEEAIQLNRALRPDVILMDLRMPGIGGMEAVRRIHARYPLTKIIILTALRNKEYLPESIDAGAAGFIQKDASADTLITAIKEVVCG